MLNLVTTDDGTHSASDYQEIGVRGLMSEPGVSDFADGQGLFSILKLPVLIAT